MASSSVLIWILTGLTFCFSLFAVIDQAALRRSFGTRVFNVDANGIATLVSPERQRLILGPDQPEDVYSIPEGSIYISAPTLFSTGHLMKPDGYGNLALFSQSDGLQTRVATFTAGGSVSLGQLPPPRSLWSQPGKIHISGTPAQLTRDGWQISSETNITNPDGEIIGSMSSAQYLEKPGLKGIQFYDYASRQTITFADGVLFVGYVDSRFYTANKDPLDGSPNVLIGGNQIYQDPVKIKYKCIPTQSTFVCGGNQYLRIETLRDGADPDYHCYNGKESDIDLSQTVFLNPGQDKPVSDAKVVSELIQAAQSEDPGLNLEDTYTQITNINCASESVTVTFGSANAESATQDAVLNLDKVYSMTSDTPTKNIYLSCQCPFNEATVQTILPQQTD